MKLVWLTDIHLNFLNKEERRDFFKKIIETQSDCVLITGDIAEAISVRELLLEMANYIKMPIYFVLGNHDYYFGQIDKVHSDMKALTESNKNLFWLPAAGPQKIMDGIFLVGQDGWADGFYGDYGHSPVVLNDSRLIVDLFQARSLGKYNLLEKMQQLANRDAKQLQENFKNVLTKKPKKIIVLTHVPPFKEACMHLGKMSDEDWLPFFTSKATGDVLMEVANRNSKIDFLVLCGHTHSSAHYQLMKNLIIKAGSAEYYRPEIQDVINIE